VPSTTGGALVRKKVALALAALFSALVCVTAVGPGVAHAAGESIFGFLKDNQQPIQGVKVAVTGPNGFKGESASDAKGRWEVKVPGPGTYTVTIDAKSLPKGVNLRDEKFTSLKVPVAVDQNKPVLFPLGKSTRKVTGTWDQAAQLTAEGLRFGLIIALAAVGLSLIFGTTGLTNFAHGELVTLGGLLAYLFNATMGLPFLLAAALALIAMGVFGWANDAGLWAPLRRRGTGLIAAMIVSIGMSIFLRYLLLYLFGGSTRSYEAYRGQSGIDIGPISLAAKDYLSMLIAVVVLIAVAFALLRTRLGKATRAVADNPALAAASGIDVDRVIRVVWIAGATLAGLAGILLGLAQQVSFQMGFQILLLIFAAVTLGGLGTAYGALVGSIVVGMFVSVSTLWIPIELKNVGALGILILILLVRPQGILGRAQRVG
jgi:branched-chain amino acid transport system permease protein